MPKSNDRHFRWLIPVVITVWTLSAGLARAQQPPPPQPSIPAVGMTTREAELERSHSAT